MPASTWIAPPYASATPKTIGSPAAGSSPALNRLSRNVVSAKQARPSGPGSAIMRTFSEASSLAMATRPAVGSLRSARNWLPSSVVCVPVCAAGSSAMSALLIEAGGNARLDLPEEPPAHGTSPEAGGHPCGTTLTTTTAGRQDAPGVSQAPDAAASGLAGDEVPGERGAGVLLPHQAGEEQHRAPWPVVHHETLGLARGVPGDRGHGAGGLAVDQTGVLLDEAVLAVVADEAELLTLVQRAGV